MREVQTVSGERLTRKDDDQFHTQRIRHKAGRGSTSRLMDARRICPRGGLEPSVEGFVR